MMPSISSFHAFAPISCGPRFFEPAEIGPRAIIFDVTADDVWLDQVAWHPHRPGRWWVRTGAAVFLGEDALIDARWHAKPLLIHETPRDWIIAGCDGAVILDWRADLYPSFIGIADLRCATTRLAARLRETLARPRINIGVADGRRAA